MDRRSLFDLSRVLAGPYSALMPGRLIGINFGELGDFGYVDVDPIKLSKVSRMA